MTAHFWIPGPLRSMTGGRSRVDVETPGGTLKDALEALFSAHPGIRDRVLTEQGEIRPHVNVFVGKSEARSTGGLATSLADDTEISIIPAISGGEFLPRVELAFTYYRVIYGRILPGIFSLSRSNSHEIMPLILPVSQGGK